MGFVADGSLSDSPQGISNFERQFEVADDVGLLAQMLLDVGLIPRVAAQRREGRLHPLRGFFEEICPEPPFAVTYYRIELASESWSDYVSIFDERYDSSGL